MKKFLLNTNLPVDALKMPFSSRPFRGEWVQTLKRAIYLLSYRRGRLLLLKNMDERCVKRIPLLVLRLTDIVRILVT